LVRCDYEDHQPAGHDKKAAHNAVIPQGTAICALDPDTTRHFLFWTRMAAPLIASGRLA
jgi:hypothetical protein